MHISILGLVGALSCFATFGTAQTLTATPGPVTGDGRQRVLLTWSQPLQGQVTVGAYSASSLPQVAGVTPTPFTTLLPASPCQISTALATMNSVIGLCILVASGTEFAGSALIQVTHSQVPQQSSPFIFGITISTTASTSNAFTTTSYTFVDGLGIEDPTTTSLSSSSTGRNIPTAPNQSIPQATSDVLTVSSSATSAGGASSTSSGVVATPTATNDASAGTVSSESGGGGLGTGAKVGIAVGVVAAALIAALIAFLFWRRKRRSDKESTGMAYANNLNSTERDLHAEKEMNVVNTTTAYTPVDNHGSFDETEAAHRSPHSYNTVPVGAGLAAGVAAGHHEDSYRDVPNSPPVRSASPVSSGPAERAMSPEEQARWDEEEARLDAAIAEAERRK